MLANDGGKDPASVRHEDGTTDGTILDDFDGDREREGLLVSEY